MLCQNCGKNEVNFRYTQIINGVKKEMALCEKCAKDLGLEKMDFNIPINFSSFFGNFFEDAEESFLPNFAQSNALQCNVCGMTYDEFIDKYYDLLINNENKYYTSHVPHTPFYI